MSITIGRAAAWLEWRAKNTPMPETRAMFEMAAAALREKAEREDPTPLTFEELLQMNGEPVWFKTLDANDYDVPTESTWTQVWVWDQKSMSFFSFGNECDLMPKKETYGKTWVCYRHKPKEVCYAE